jgi:hydrogenase nickel incorporation protein HypA/HybF
MHETGLMRAVISAAERIATAEGASRVVRITVGAGNYSGLEAEHLAGHFRLAASGTMAQDAEFVVNESEGTGLILESVEVE